MAANDIVARYVLKFHDLASKGMLGVSHAANSLVGQLAALGGAAAGFQSAMEFQNILTDIEQKSAGGAQAIAGLDRRLQEAAISAGQLPVEAAKAYDALLGMGADNKTADAMIGPMLRTATAYRAASDDIAKAGFAAIDTLKVPAKEVAKVLDALASASKDGKIEMRDMAQSFPSLAAQMATLGGRGTGAVASLAAALETVGKAAGSPEEAATNFSNLLSKIDSKETRDRFKKLGVDLPKELKKRTDAGEDIIQAFIGELGELEKRGINIKDVVSDQQAGLALAALRQNYAEYIKMRDKAAGSGGIVDADFARRMKDFQPKLNQFIGLLQKLAIQVLEPLIDALSPVLTMITSLGTQFPTATTGVVQMSGAFIAANKFLAIFGATWSTVIGKVVASRFAGVVVNGFIAMSGAIVPAAVAAWSFTAAMLANPITWIVAGVVALGAGIYLVWKNWDKVSAAMKTGWEAIKKVGAAAWDSIMSASASVLNWIIDKLNIIIRGWNSLTPASMRIPTLEAIPNVSVAAAQGVAGRSGGPQRVSGEAVVTLRNQDGSKAGTAYVPFQPVGSNRPRPNYAGAFGR